MSASMHHPDHFRQALRASVKVRPEEKALTDAISDCRASLYGIERQIGFRVDNDAVGANHQMLAAIRRLAGDLMAAADEYQRSGQ